MQTCVPSMQSEWRWWTGTFVWRLASAPTLLLDIRIRIIPMLPWRPFICHFHPMLPWRHCNRLSFHSRYKQFAFSFLHILGVDSWNIYVVSNLSYLQTLVFILDFLSHFPISQFLSKCRSCDRIRICSPRHEGFLILLVTTNYIYHYS